MGAVYFLTMYLERGGSHYLHSQFLLPITLLLLHRNLCFFEMTVTELIYPRPLLIAVICTPLWLTDFLFSPIMLNFWVVLASLWYTTPASQFLDPLYFSDFHLHSSQTNQSPGHIPSLSWVETFTSKIAYTSHANCDLLFFSTRSLGYSFHSCLTSLQPPVASPE